MTILVCTIKIISRLINGTDTFDQDIFDMYKILARVCSEIYA